MAKMPVQHMAHMPHGGGGNKAAMATLLASLSDLTMQGGLRGGGMPPMGGPGMQHPMAGHGMGGHHHRGSTSFDSLTGMPGPMQVRREWGLPGCSPLPA